MPLRGHRGLAAACRKYIEIRTASVNEPETSLRQLPSGTYFPGFSSRLTVSRENPSICRYKDLRGEFAMLGQILRLGVAAVALLSLAALDAAAQSSGAAPPSNAPAGGVPPAAAAAPTSQHVDLPPLPAGKPTNADGS